MFPGPGTVHSTGGGGSFTGAGDVVTGADFYWSLRAYNVAKASAGVAAINLCNGGSCGDVHVTSAGGLNASDISALGCNSINTCTIQTFYDQTGNGVDVSQGTAANRATFQNNCNGSLPCAVLIAGSSYVSTATPFRAQPFTLVGAGNRTSGSTEVDLIVQNVSCCVVIGFANSANTAIFYGGNAVTPAAADNTWHVLQALFNSTSSTVAVDGSQTTGQNVGLSTFATAVVHLGNTSSSVVQFTEAGLWNASFTGTNMTNMNSNIHGYWGF
jgi:hypothetical protein